MSLSHYDVTVWVLLTEWLFREILRFAQDDVGVCDLLSQDDGSRHPEADSVFA